MFDDLKLDQYFETSIEYLFVGTTIRQTIPDKSIFFFITGAFHTANNTYDIYKRYYFAHSTNTYDDTYRY